MSNCYKNFPVIINYSNGTSDTIYSNTTSLSESLNIERSSSVGAKGSDVVFSKTVPKGQIDVDAYLMDDLNVYNQLRASNDQNIDISFGPYECPAPCIMSNMTINISVDNPITIKRTFDYFGEVTVGSSPTPSIPSLSPITAEKILFNGFTNIGGSSQINSITWSFTQTYDEYYLLGQRVPTIVFKEGQIALNIQGEGFTEPLVSTGCLVAPKAYNLSVYGCGGANLGTLTVNGYMQSRGSSVSSDSDETNSVSIIQYL